MVGFFIGLMVGVVATLLWTFREREGGRPKRAPLPVDLALDLVRRLHGAQIVCLVAPDDQTHVVPTAGRDAPARLRDRVEALARLAMADPREHLVQDGDTLVAAGQEGWGVAVAFDGVENRDLSLVLEDAKRLLSAAGQPDLIRLPGPRERVAPRAGMDSLAGVAAGLSERARSITGRDAAVVVRDAHEPSYSVVAVSRGVDRRLVGLSIPPDSAVGRAAAGDSPIVAHSHAELFGHLPRDRRRRQESGTVYPLRDHGRGVGALVVFGPHAGVTASDWEQVMWLVADSGSQFAAAVAVKQADDRAMTDPLTGLPNRTALDRAMADPQVPCAILCLDVDHFKRLNDTLGHAAGDAALKQIATVLRRVLRNGDLPARIGGEEFALWLPMTDQETAVEVAERVRRAVADTPFQWGGVSGAVTCSIGVASCPDTTTRVENLLTAADAALYRAKRSGRNRVVEADPRGPEPTTKPPWGRDVARRP